MNNIQSFDEFLNEGKFGRALAGTAMSAGLLMGSPVFPQINKPDMEQTITKERISDIETKIVVGNLLECGYEYDGYDLNTDGSYSVYFYKNNDNVVLDCILNAEWDNGDFNKFIIKNSILKQ